MSSVSSTTQKFTQEKLAEQKAAAKKAKANGTNPGAQLDKDAFMKLLLTELKYQDPTSPMDTEKMLTQTSQLATLEMQENTNSAMKKLVTQLKSNSNMYAMGALGKIASLGTDRVNVKSGVQKIKAPLYFANNVAKGLVEIIDSNGKTVRTMGIKNVAAGTHNLDWDCRDNGGNLVKPGSYMIRVRYIGTDKRRHMTKYGTYPIEGVKFKDGKALAKIGENYIPMDNIAEFYEPVKQQASPYVPSPTKPTTKPTTKPKPKTSSPKSDKTASSGSKPTAMTQELAKQMSAAAKAEASKNKAYEDAASKAYDKLSKNS